MSGTTAPLPADGPGWTGPTSARAAQAMGVGERVSAISLQEAIALCKPSITVMSVLVAAGSYAIAPGPTDLAHFGLTLLATALSVMGAGALNMFLERDVDGLMARTRTRPLPSGRTDPLWALVFGGAFSALSMPLMWMAGGALAAGLTAFALFAYVLVYTPMKRVSWLSVVVGAVPGAMPAAMGYAARAGEIDLVGASLFSILFLWQLPHFVAISVYRQNEYAKAGYRVLPADHGLDAAKSFIVGTAVPLAAASMSLVVLGVAGVIYGLTVGLLSLWFVVLCALGFTAERGNSWARRVFLGSLVYQVVLFGVLALDVTVTRMFVS